MEHFWWKIFVGTFLLEHFCWQLLLEHFWWNIFVGTFLLEHEKSLLQILVEMKNPCCNSLLKNPWIFQQGFSFFNKDFSTRISNNDFQQDFSNKHFLTRIFQQGFPTRFSNKDFSTRIFQQGFFNKDFSTRIFQQGFLLVIIVRNPCNALLKNPCWKILVGNHSWKSLLPCCKSLLVHFWWNIFVGRFLLATFVGTFLLVHFWWNIFIGTFLMEHYCWDIFVETLKILVGNPCCNSLLKTPCWKIFGFFNKDFQQGFLQQGFLNKDFSTRISNKDFSTRIKNPC